MQFPIALIRILQFFRSYVIGLGLLGLLVSPTSGQDPVASDPVATDTSAQPETQADRAGTARKAPGDANRDRRLREIENVLRDLLKEVQSLRDPDSGGGSASSDNETVTKTPTTRLSEEWLKAVTWRPIGPANMGGRIVDIAVYDGDPVTYWAATASGGLLKTENNGVTFEHQFDHETTVSLGAVAVAAADPKVVWVGTGENNPRNSVSYGDGVYKSTDGGQTWKHMGLKESYQIGRILIDPEDPNIVYVGALGRLYGPNKQRGVFKTSDGGETWNKVLYVDEETGVIDMRMHPTDSNKLVVAMWGRQRDGFDSWPGNEVPVQEGYDGYDPIQKWGPGGGLFKTSDGGASWKKLTKGLPSSNFGRVGLDWYRKDPLVLYAIIDCADIAKGPKPFSAYLGVVGQNVDGEARFQQVIPESPAAKAGLEVGDVLKAVGEQQINDFDQLLDQLRPMRAGQKLTLQISRGEESKTVEVTLSNRPGRRRRGSTVWLGVTGENRSGQVHLTQVIPAGPAAEGGLKVGDVVLTAENKQLDDYNDLLATVREKQAGDKLTLQVARGQEKKELTVTLADRPGTRPPPSNVFMGIRGEDAEGGARLTQVTQGGPAEQAGLQSGDLIKEIQGKEIADYAALVAEIRSRKPDDKMKVTVLRKEEKKELLVTLAERTSGSQTRPFGFSYGGQSPNVQDQQGARGFEYGGVYKSTDEGESWTRINSLNSRPMYFSQIRVDPSDDQNLYVLGVSQYRSSNGGQTFEADLGRGVHADGHALWINPRDGRHLVIGSDGGIYVTYDRGANWDHLNHLAIGQFYHVAISAHEPYYVTGGLQDNGTWFGPSLTKSGSGPINADWQSVGGGDGFMCRVDPDDPDLVYYTSQNGAMRRRNLRTGERASLRPRPANGAPPYRFNWNTPFILSSQNSRVFYCAGNFVFRSISRGNNLEKISPEITLTKRGSATAMAESPRDANVLYAGTDDGALWVTRDGGRKWQEISKNVGLPGPRWVATIEASQFENGRVYVAFDAHRSDDDDPYVYVSEDYGETWKSLRANLPRGSTRCLREDLKSQDLLFAGTEFGAWFSLDRGNSWNKFNTNLPTVAILELALHPTNGELVAATHGRSLWICDVSMLRQIKPAHLRDQIALYEPEPAIRWQRQPTRGRTNRRFVGSNPQSGAKIYYSLPKDAQQVSLKILDIEGRIVRELAGPAGSGLHRVTWDLARVAVQPRAEQRREESPAAPATGRRGRARRGAADDATPSREPTAGQTPNSAGEAAGQGSSEAPRPGRAGRRPASSTPQQARPATPQRPSPGRTPPRGGAGRRERTRAAGPGSYRIVLNVDGQEYSQTIRLQRDPNAPPSIAAEEDELDQAELSEEKEETGNRIWIDD